MDGIREPKNLRHLEDPLGLIASVGSLTRKTYGYEILHYVQNDNVVCFGGFWVHG